MSLTTRRNSSIGGSCCGKNESFVILCAAMCWKVSRLSWNFSYLYGIVRVAVVLYCKMVNGLNPGVSVIGLSRSSNNSLSKGYPHPEDHDKPISIVLCTLYAALHCVMLCSAVICVLSCCAVSCRIVLRKSCRAVSCRAVSRKP